MSKVITLLLCFALSFASGNSVDDTNAIRIGLALSGGAALGFAHLGVLKVLEKEQIPISYIAGNSMGSLIGGLYAAGYSTAQIESIANTINWWTIFSSEIPFGARYLRERQQSKDYVFQLRHSNFIPAFPSGLVPIQNIEFLLMKLLAEIEYNTFYEFDSLVIPYRAIAVDLASGEKVIFKNKRLANAIRSSIAIPGVFAPEIVNGKSYVDGGLIQNLPVEPLLEFKPDLIIASLTSKHNPETGLALLDIVSRSIDLVGIEDLKRQKQLADILIEPNVDPFTHSDFFRWRELIKAGEEAAQKALPAIKAKIKWRKVVQPNRKIIKRPLPIIRSITFQGICNVPKSLLLHKLAIQTNTVLEFDKLIAGLTRLYYTDYFEHVDYRLEFATVDSVDVIIELQEKPMGFYNFGVVYDNYDNINFGLEVGQGNLAGSGINIRGVMQLGNPNEFRFGIYGTRLFNFPFGYHLDGYWNSIKRAYYQNHNWQTDYLISNRGGILEFGYILGRDAFFDFGFEAVQSRYRKPAQLFFDSFPEQQLVVGPGFRLEFNNFNNYFFPTKGISYQLKGQYSTTKLGASKNFLKVDYSSEQVIKLTDRLLLQPGLEIGMSWGELTLAEYYYIGVNRFVGFDKDELMSNQKTIARLLTSFKLFQLFKRDDYPFYLQMHFNLGTFRQLTSIYRAFNFTNDLHWGVGIGIKTNTPIGPIQVMLGIPDLAKTAFTQTKANFTITVGRDFRYDNE